MALAFGAELYVLDDLSAKNLNETFGIDVIRNLRKNHKGGSLNKREMQKVNDQFKKRVLEHIS